MSNSLLAPCCCMSNDVILPGIVPETLTAIFGDSDAPSIIRRLPENSDWVRILRDFARIMSTSAIFCAYFEVNDTELCTLKLIVRYSYRDLLKQIQNGFVDRIGITALYDRVYEKLDCLNKHGCIGQLNFITSDPDCLSQIKEFVIKFYSTSDQSILLNESKIILMVKQFTKSLQLLRENYCVPRVLSLRDLFLYGESIG